jgi:hypothetical protein
MMGLSNSFYIGVVEDRHDPLKMGRVRVRVFGLHSRERKNDIPISALPWSMVMQPPNTPTPAGNLSQMVEGTWVVVMYLDDAHQDPLVIGSIPSNYEEQPDYEDGFSDPFGVFPRWSGEDDKTDVSLITDVDRWTEHPTYDERKKKRITDIPLAKKYEIPTVSATAPDEEYERSTWNENDLRGLQSSDYPYNSVREFEAGMVEEYDSTSENTRITEMHQSGTYREILDDGTTTTKIVGDGYSITLKDHNIYIEGDLNMTVKGDMRQLVEGDYTLEVDGSYHQFVRGNRETKIGSNDATEIGADSSTNAGQKYSLHAGSDATILFDTNHTKNIGGNSNTSIKGNRSLVTVGDSSEVVLGSQSIVSIGKRLVTTEGLHRMESVANVEIETESQINETAEGNVTIIGNRIDLNP